MPLGNRPDMSKRPDMDNRPDMSKRRCDMKVHVHVTPVSFSGRFGENRAPA